MAAKNVICGCQRYQNRQLNKLNKIDISLYLNCIYQSKKFGKNLQGKQNYFFFLRRIVSF